MTCLLYLLHCVTVPRIAYAAYQTWIAYVLLRCAEVPVRRWLRARRRQS
jgi:hypothetical protein